jgi:drug/metabolite transporter (DMT)-like permease
MKTKNKYVAGITFTILSSICFGTMGWFNDFSERANFPIPQRVFFRFLIALIIISIIIKVQKKSFKIDKSTIKKVSFGSIVYFSFTSIFLTLAYNIIGIGMSTVLHFTYPIIVLLFAIILDKERPAKLQIVGTVAALSGLVIVIGPQLQSNVVGIIFALLSAITFTMYVRMLDKPYCKSVDTFVLMFYVFLSSTIFWIFPALISAHNNSLPVDYKLVAISLFGLAIVGTLLSSSFFNLGVKMIGGRMTSILSVFEPVTSVLLGVILLNELLTKYFGFGMVLIIIGVIMVTLFENSAKEDLNKAEKIA